MSKIEFVTKANFRELVDSVDTILTDCDGVIWNESTPIEGAIDTMQQFVDMGKSVYYVTNNSTKTIEQYEEKCKQLGFPAKSGSVIGSSQVTASYIKNKLGYSGKVYMIGSSGLEQELKNVGLIPIGLGPDNGVYKTLMERVNVPIDPEIKCVVAGYDPDFSYTKMLKASAYICQPGCHFVSTNTDPFLPMGNRKIPGTGSIITAVEVATQIKSIVCGKPSKIMFEALEATQPVNRGRTLMIGDRMDTDILFGNVNGVRTLLVGTGASSLEQAQTFEKGTSEEKLQVPTYYMPTLGGLGHFLKQSTE